MTTPANHRIKVFVDAHSFDAGYQGVQTFIRELYTALYEQYHDLEIFMGASNISNLRQQLPWLDAAHALPYGKRAGGILRFWWAIPRLIKQYQFQYAHFQYLCPGAIKQCRYIITSHDVLFKDFPQYFPWSYRLIRSILFRNCFKRADIATTVSAYSRKQVMQHYQPQSSAVHVVPNIINGNSVNRQQASIYINRHYRIPDYLLYVSRIEPRKNHPLLLRAYLNLELYTRGIHLVFIGGNSVPNKALNLLFKEMPPAARPFVHHLTAVDQAELDLFYSACRLFVYPSIAEGFGIPPLEAALHGAPVLCSSTTAMEEFSFFHPYRFAPDDPVAFQQLLGDMINQLPGADMIERNKQLVRDKYNRETIAAGFYSLLKQDLYATA